MKTVPKVIIFSQFSSFLDRIVLELRRLKIDFADIAAGSEAVKERNLQRFTHIDGCRCLLLSTDGARGLDLSFVTHIFIMDSLVDSSLEQQVTISWSNI